MSAAPGSHRWRTHILILAGLGFTWFVGAGFAGVFREKGKFLDGLGQALVAAMIAGLLLVYAAATTLCVAISRESRASDIHAQAAKTTGAVIGLLFVVAWLADLAK